MSTTASRQRLLRLGVSVAVLVAVAGLVDPRAVVSRLIGTQPGWVAVGVMISALQVGVCAVVAVTNVLGDEPQPCILILEEQVSVLTYRR